MLSLKSFHLFLIGVAIVLTAGYGTWALLNSSPWYGALSLAVSVLLVIYIGYFVGRSSRIHLE
jgi:membrane protein implicated in regulation of membrane protease activity